MDCKWVRFWFEGNMYFNWVNNADDWQKVKREYVIGMKPRGILRAGQLTIDELLDRAKECPRNGEPKFGFASECIGPRTLRQFFDENGLEY